MRIGKALIIAGSSVFVLIPFLCTQLSAPDAVTNSPVPVSDKLRPSVGGIVKHESPGNDGHRCAVDSPLYSAEKRIASASAVAVATEQEITRAYSDIASILSESRTDPRAAVALFELASSCYPGPIESRKLSREIPVGCPELDIRQLVRKHPIEILKRAVELGSEQAKFRFALNAPAVAEQFRQIGRPEDVGFIASLRADAELYGTEVARAGNPDALRYMSRAYETAEFVERDLEKAYSFALPLQFIGSVDDKKRISSLKGKLNQTQQLSAQQQAFGCSPSSDSSTYRNPFS
jgi:hypothetical protein